DILSTASDEITTGCEKLRLFSDTKWKSGEDGAYKKAITKLLLLLREAQRDGELPSFVCSYSTKVRKRILSIQIGLRWGSCLEIFQTNLLLLCGETHRK